MYKAAIDDYGLALARDPESATACNNRGNTQQNLGDWLAGRGEDPRRAYQAAIDDYGSALARNLEFPGAYNNRGNALRSLGDQHAARGEDPRPAYQAAIDDYDAALARNPTDWIVHANKGLLLCAMGRYPEAVGALERAHAIVGDGHPPLMQWLAQARALAADAGGAADLLTRGKSLCQAGRWKEGLAALAKAVEAGAQTEEGADPTALNTYAWYLATCEDPELDDPATALPYAERAVSILRERLALAPEDDGALQETVANALDTLAECLWRTGERERAVETQREAVGLAPGNRALREKLDRWERGG